MSRKIPRFINHPIPGQLISVNSTAAAAIGDLTASGAVRQVRQDGRAHILRADVEPYCVTDFEEASDLDKHADSDGESASDQLRSAIQLQATTDVQLINARKTLVRRVVATLHQPTTTNAFAQALTWPAIWEAVVFICTNTAGEVDAERIGQAYHGLTALQGDRPIDERAFAGFHRELLFLAAPELDGRFAEIWREGRGLISLPNDQRTETVVLSVLRRLVALIAGFSGVPEGSENASSITASYFQVVRVGG